MIPIPNDLHPNKIVKDCRAGMSEWKPENAFNLDFKPEYDYVQYKQDGWWIAVLIKDGAVFYITSGAEVRHSFLLPAAYQNVSALFIAEWMYGTSWSQAKDRNGKIILHDVVYICSEAININTIDSKLQYGTRLEILEHNRELIFGIFGDKAEVIETYIRFDIKNIWDLHPDYEGLVLKNSHALFMEKGAFVKVKHTFTLDYVCTSIVEGQGRLKGRMGAIAGSLYKADGSLVAVVAVGGGFGDQHRSEIWNNKEKYIGMVFEAEGKGLFRKVCLRHPVFLRWREDKLASMCRWPE